MPDNAPPVADGGSVQDDIRADVAAAYATLTQDDGAPDTKPAAEQPASTGPTRNERGQFTKADGADLSAPLPDNAQPDAKAPAEQQVAAQPDATAAPAVAPASWTADEKAKWATLDPAVQRAIARRETEMDNGGRQWSDTKRAYEATLAPIAAVARENGLDVRQGVERLVSMERWLARDPQAAVAAIAQAYGVKIGGSAAPAPAPPASRQAGAQQQPAPVADPRVDSVIKVVQSLANAHTQRERGEVVSTLEAFRAAPGHEHFDAVRVRMGQEFALAEQNRQAISLQEAYDRAIWATPDVRAKLIAAQGSNPGAQQRQQQDERSRRAAVSVKGSPAGSPASKPQDYATVEDAVRAAYAQHAGT